MKFTELAKEYETQCEVLETQIAKLKSLSLLYKSQDLVDLRKKIKIYEDMLLECKYTVGLLSGYYEED